MRRQWLLILVVVAATNGCGALRSRTHHGGGRQGVLPLENPLLVPPVNDEYLWNQVIDTVDDYFKIEREDRIRVVGGVISEGRIETFPETGSGFLEPWRRDSTRGRERMLASLQSIRRRALLRVTPAPDGYLIHVTVLKELEDVSQPEFSTIGGAAARHDGTVVRTTPLRGAEPVSLGWIQMGRDPALEQQILYEIQYRLMGGLAEASAGASAAVIRFPRGLKVSQPDPRPRSTGRHPA